MESENKKYDTVIIVGNGFDLNIGLKTGYYDFINSFWFKDLIEDNNQLAIYLNKKQRLQNWIDIEAELKEYSLNWTYNLDRILFRREFNCLREKLCNYINQINICEYNQESTLCKCLEESTHYGMTLIADFNYTNSVRQIIGDDREKVDIVNMHGIASDNSIIFGVEEQANIDEEDAPWLVKAYSPHNIHYNLSKKLREAENVVFLGHSLGESDHTYFKDYFQDRCTGINSKDILITYFKDKGREAIMSQLRILTHKNYSKFRQSNNVVEFDSSKPFRF